MQIKTEIIRRTRQHIRRPKGQTVIDGDKMTMEVVSEERYDFTKPEHRQNIMNMMAMSAFVNYGYDINKLNNLIDEMKAAIDTAIDTFSFDEI